jgi:hypothetical protein
MKLVSFLHLAGHPGIVVMLHLYSGYYLIYLFFNLLIMLGGETLVITDCDNNSCRLIDSRRYILFHSKFFVCLLLET